MIIDLNDPTSTEFTMDTEVDMARVAGAPKLEKTMTELWQNDKHFIVPTRELAGGPGFNLKETYEKILLEPSKN